MVLDYCTSFSCHLFIFKIKENPLNIFGVMIWKKFPTEGRTDGRREGRQGMKDLWCHRSWEKEFKFKYANSPRDASPSLLRFVFFLPSYRFNDARHSLRLCSAGVWGVTCHLFVRVGWAWSAFFHQNFTGGHDVFDKAVWEQAVEMQMKPKVIYYTYVPILLIFS